MATTHSFRQSLISKEQTYQLGSEEISISSEGKEILQVPYSDVKAIRLEYNGSMNGVQEYRCVIKSNRKQVVVQNKHFVGVGNFEPRDSSYRQFVADLHDRLRPHADSIKFTQGTEWLFWFAVVFGVLMPPMFLAGLYILFFTDKGTFSGRAALFGVPAMFLCFIVPVWRRGRAKNYEPTSVPEDFLP